MKKILFNQKILFVYIGIESKIIELIYYFQFNENLYTSIIIVEKMIFLRFVTK